MVRVAATGGTNTGSSRPAGRLGARRGLRRRRRERAGVGVGRGAPEVIEGLGPVEVRLLVGVGPGVPGEREASRGTAAAGPRTGAGPLDRRVVVVGGPLVHAPAIPPTPTPPTRGPRAWFQKPTAPVSHRGLLRPASSTPTHVPNPYAKGLTVVPETLGSLGSRSRSDD